MQGSQKVSTHVGLKTESVWFKAKLISQFLTLSFLLTQPFYLSYLHAAPIGGEVVDGSGTITQIELTTTINQTSQNLAIDWQSFDVDTNERVQFIQPDTTSIALNRILGNNGSTIQGQIDANGQVILVNPNGIFFTSTATINVGGLVASSLDMTPSDFMNGNYVFNEVLGADGAVINSGIINASVGGNVALIGKQVKNDGLISANLGSVILAAGKQSILTFDNQGLIGVQVTKEVLQDEIGLEEAVINSGDINAAGGRVLLTASTSQDVFSQAVNTGVLDQATSVVVNDDGTFTLGAGADVLNTGSIDVSTDVNTDNAARIVLLGENITSSGQISADVIDGQAGEIELHATDEMLLTENSITSAQALLSGQGGLIKILGDKVGLFDSAQVNASGANGGGEVLIGGDKQGLNTSIRNANFIYLGENTSVNADATLNGDGGKIITFAKDTARIYANLFARGGAVSGNGGFIETSGLKGFEITKAPDVSAFNGNGGLWLIDPNNIRIINDTVATDPEQTSNITTTSPFETSDDGAILEVGLIKSALVNGDVVIETTSSGTDGDEGDITFEADLDIDNSGNRDRTLDLIAQRDITFADGSSIFSSNANTDDSLNIRLTADSNNDGFGNVNFNDMSIDTYGGDLDIVNVQDVNFNAGSINTFNNGATSGGGNLVVLQAVVVNFNGSSINTANGNVDIQNSSSVAFNGGSISTNGGLFNLSTLGNVTSATATTNFLTTSGGNFIVDDAINFDSSYVNINVGSGDIDLDGVTNDVILGDAQGSGLSVIDVNSVSQATGTSLIFTNASFKATATTDSVVLLNSSNDFDTIKLEVVEAKVSDKDDVDLSDGTTVSSLLNITAAGAITDSGSVIVSNGAGTAETYFNTSGSIVIDGGNDNFNKINFINASSVDVTDSAGGIAIAANDGVGSGGVTGNLSIKVIGGDITSFGEVNAGANLGTSSFTVDDTRSIYLGDDLNSFAGTVNFISNKGNIDNLTFTDSTALVLPIIDITGNLIVKGDSISFKQTHINTDSGTGIFSATTTNSSGLGTITQDSSEILVGGTATTTLNATGDITLNDSDNDFQTVTITNGKAVSLSDTNSLSLLSSNTLGNLSIRADDNISLVGDITTSSGTTDAGNVQFTGDVLLATPTDGGTIIINTNHATLADGTVTFIDNVDNDVATTSTDRNNLEIISGDGDVDFQGGVGTSTANIGSLVINQGLTSKATVNLSAINTLTYSLDTTNAVDITAGTIYLDGNIVTNGGDSGHARGISLDGNVVLESDIVLLTEDVTSDGSVTITGSINSASTSRQLTIESDTGTVDLQNNIGGTSALSSLDITGGIVNLSEVTTNGGEDVINVEGSTINLNGDLKSNADNKGGDILLTGNVQLNQSIVITSDAAGNGGGDGDVTITGTVNATSNNPSQSLTINSDDNNISVDGSIGGLVALQKVEFFTDENSNTQINVGAITTTDSLVGIDDSGVVLTAKTINLAGNITANTGIESGSVTVNGAAVLTGDVTIDTYLAGTTTGGDVTFSGTVDADDAANDRDFSINVGNAIADISGIVGTTDAYAVNSFSVTSAGTTNINEINTQVGGIDITSGIINLNGNLNTKALVDAGQITLVGAVNLNSDTAFDTEGVDSDADIFIDGSVNNTTSRALILNAGSADVTMTGTAGAGTALKSLNVTGENVDVGQVTSNGDIDITGNASVDLLDNLTSNSGLIDLQNGAVTIYDNVILSVSDSNTVTVDGTIDADDAANDHSFTVNAGSGDVTLKGDIGLIQAVQGLAISTTGTARIQNVNTRSDGVVISSNTLNLSGSIDTTDDVTTAGEVSLTQENLNLSGNININTNSIVGIDGNISIFDLGLPTDILGDNNSFVLDAGTGSVEISTNLTNLSSFSIANSQMTTLNGVETNNGTITVNADNDITLNGDYDSGTADMSFNADVDYNSSGLLSLSDTSSFSGNNITFSSFTLYAKESSVIAVDTVTFNNTLGSIVIGEYYSFATSYLSNAFLDNVTANTVQVSSDNNYTMLNGADLSGNSYSLDLDAFDINSFAADSQLNDLNATATNSIYLYENITALNDISLNAPVIYTSNIAPSIEITSTSGSVDVAGSIEGFASLNLNAVSGSVSLLGDTTVTLSNDLLFNASVVNHDNIVATNNINIISGTGYTQTGNLESTNGDISIVANSGNIDLDYNKTNYGLITVDAQNGSINDNNGDAINIETSGEINLTATGGIGHNDPLEIITNGTGANLIAINNGSGNIEIINTGNITLTDITNNATNSAFLYTGLGGDVTITKVTLDKAFNNTSAIADFNIINGDILGDPSSIKHIEANTAQFDMNGTGSIGDVYNDQPLIVEVPYKLTDINSLSTYIKYFEGRAPFIYEGANEFKNKALQAIENLSGQQLIDVEALADVDEAIFTDVRNYSSSDIALMMPSDQRYTEDEEEDEEEKLKREKYINTVH